MAWKTNYVVCESTAARGNGPRATMRKTMLGREFGRLLVTREVRVADRAHLFYECLCECGQLVTVAGYKLRRGDTRSCGCLQREETSARLLEHGMSRTAVHYSWKDMLKRCEHATRHNIKNYQERGIKVCERWHSFALFLHDMGEPGEGQTLERIDNQGNYEPGNCKWASRKVQANNRRSNHVLTFAGRTQTMQQWAEEIGMQPRTLWMRICKYEWPVELALTVKTRPNKRVRAEVEV